MPLRVTLAPVERDHLIKEPTVLPPTRRWWMATSGSRTVAVASGIPTVGISKRHFVEGITTEVLRSMHGPHRIPTLLKRVDGLNRGR